MVTRAEKKRRILARDNKKFGITSLLLLIPSGIAVIALVQTYGLEDRLQKIEQRTDQLEEYKSTHALQIENFEKRIDSTQTARTDTLE